MGSLKIMPLGGLGEIGMNSLVLEQNAQRIMIDCGVTFDDGDNGIDTYHPRFDGVVDEPDALAGIVATHGHEDHIGAIPHLLAALEAAGRTAPVPLWSTAYTLALCARRLEESRSGLAVVPMEIEPRVPFEAGPFQIEAVRMTHSIPEATALSVSTAAGRVIHSGDFKLDAEPRDGVCSDLERLTELGDDGVALLMSDSTNVLRPGTATSERVVADALHRVIGEARERVVVGLFASNIHRMDAVAQAAVDHGRKLCLLGRSVRDHSQIARRLGVVSWKSDWVVSPEVARKMPREQIAYIASGTQAEARGALSRIAGRTHHELKLEEGDSVIFSSRVIPGNERPVFAMFNALLAQGASLCTGITHRDIHASGHGYHDELRRVLDAVRPRSFMPLHGTRLHLGRHAELAREAGVNDVLMLHDGETARLDESGFHCEGRIPAGRVATAFGQTLHDETLRQRRQIGRAGVVFVAVADGRVVVTARGVPCAAEIEEESKRIALGIIEKSARDDLGERIRRKVRRRAAERVGYKPLVEVVVWENEKS